MTISGFFERVKLNVKFGDKYFHENYTWLFNHLKHCQQVELDDLIDALQSSHYYETNTNMPETYNKLLQTDNDIESLYKIFEPNLPCIRNQKVYINDKFGTVYEGAKQSYIKKHILQNWVDEFHSYNFNNSVDKMLCGFILYLMYVRIHPHFDGNGRMGRYLFLENKLLKDKDNFCPLSIVLSKFIDIVDVHMEEIYKLLDESVNSNSTEEDYYKLNINTKILKKIYYIIYISVTFRHCVSAHDELIRKELLDVTIKHKRDINVPIKPTISSKWEKKKYDNYFMMFFDKYDDFKYIFCLTKSNHEVGRSTTLKISKEHKNRNLLLAKYLNVWIDYETHRKLIKDFGITY